MNVTIKDVAYAAGVSVVTVSRAINDKPDITPETRQKILDIAAQMGYTQNIIAKNLRAKSTKTIGIIVPDIRDPYYGEILEGCNISTLQAGYEIILSVLPYQNRNADTEIKALKTLIGKRVDGLLLQPENINDHYIHELKTCPVPFVLWNRKLDELDCSFVKTDHEKGSFLAVDHLIQKGHQKIAYLARNSESPNIKERINGCISAIQEHGLEEDSVQIYQCNDSAKAAYQTAQQILQNNKKTTAIYTYDDVMAIGVCKAVLDKGLVIPRDMAVVGYDDIEITEYFKPPLTTVRQKKIEIGEMAAKILIQEIEEKNKNKNSIILEPNLVQRETT